MTTFAKATFNVASYASFRPTYPKLLYDTIYQYHDSPHARWERAVDLGCGTGQASAVLTERFDKVIGVDPSAGMIATAKELSKNDDRLQYIHAKAEDLSSIEAESTDLVTAAQAAHWFDYSLIWPEIGRVLKKGGTAAFWCYSEFRLSKYPSLTPFINAYASDPTQSVGAHWEQPGRSILDNHLQAVHFPENEVWDTSSGRRVYFVGQHYSTTGPKPAIRLTPGGCDQVNDVILRKSLSWEDLDSYLRTWSALHTFQAKHPEDSAHPDGDIVKRLVKNLKDGVESEGTQSLQDRIEIEWPLALILLKKAS